MMPPVAIVTDSVCSVPEALLRELNIHTVAYYIHRGQEMLRDLVTIQRAEFLQWLESAKVLPTTACPGPGDYLQTYEALAKAGVTDIASLHMTSKGSGAYQAAKLAQTMAEEQSLGLRIRVIDTRNVSLCQGWMVIEAARAALEGQSLEAVVNIVSRMMPITRMIQTADTLKYLYMGGRIGLAQRVAGSLLNIKPLIGMENGIIALLGTARSRDGAYRMMADLVEAAAGKMGKIKIAYVHAGALGEVDKIRRLIEARLTCLETIIAELSPALAVHSGPGTAGLCFYPVEA
jgi:DegV family protein with EDD domain